MVSTQWKMKHNFFCRGLSVYFPSGCHFWQNHSCIKFANLLIQNKSQVTTLLLVYTLFEIPFEMAFIESDCNMTSLSTFNLMVDIVFCVDILVAFHTGFMIKIAGEDILEDNHWLIAFRYVRGWFFVDLISSIPVERFVCLAMNPASDASGADNADSMAVLRLFKMARFLKLARLIRFNRMLNKWQAMSVNKSQLNVTRLFKLVVGLLMAAHFIGCIWKILADEQGKQASVFQGID